MARNDAHSQDHAGTQAQQGRTAAWLVLIGGMSLMFAFSVGHQVLFLVGTTMIPSP